MHAESILGGGERDIEFSAADFERVRTLIRAKAGIDLNAGKQNMVYGRLSKRLRERADRRISSVDTVLRDGDGWRELAPLEVGTWYNLQFAVNWQAKTFSGTISHETRSWTFADIPLNPSWDGTADSLVDRKSVV